MILYMNYIEATASKKERIDKIMLDLNNSCYE